MSTINLKVTSKAMDYVASVAHSSQKQIAYEVSDGELYQKNLSINKRNKVTIEVANQVRLTIGDTNAIWFSHQKQPEQFEALYHLLSLNPGRNHVLQYKVV